MEPAGDEPPSPTFGLADDPSSTDYPASVWPDWVPPACTASEDTALKNIKGHWRKHEYKAPVYDGWRDNRELLLVELEDFEIYREPGLNPKRDYELVSLHIDTKGVSFNGFISLGSVRYYVQGVEIETYSIEGYGTDDDLTVTAHIRSQKASQDHKYDIWYKLGKPAANYSRFHQPFEWVAVLGKHVIDYLGSQPPGSIGLADFRSAFYRWLVERYSQFPDFQSWHEAFDEKTDFRHAINAYCEYLFQQAGNVASQALLGHPVWADCMRGPNTAILEQPAVATKTLATPEVYQCFKRMYFGKHLQKIHPTETVKKQQARRKLYLGFPEDTSQPNRSITVPEINQGPIRIEVGDVVAIYPDEKDRKSYKSVEKEWLAYVQRVEPYEDGLTRLFVLWVYQPSETSIASAKYPFTNELFFSNHCNCENGPLLSSDIVRKCSVAWSPGELSTSKDYIIRQKYTTENCAFETIREEDFKCRCNERKPATANKYCSGDTAYLTRSYQGKEIVDPVIIREVSGDGGEMRVQKLLRLERDCSKMQGLDRFHSVQPNELVLTETISTVKASRIQRACHIQFIEENDVLDDRIPFPYNREGDFWFLSMKLVKANGTERLEFLPKPPSVLNQGQTVEELPHPELLTGLSIFSGGGNLDRGLEEGGAVRFETAVDISLEALLSSRANSKNADRLKLFYGSVDDYLHVLCSGKNLSSVTNIGKVDMLTAGSPCPGFSSMQPNILSEESTRNASHITTFCSFVDLYRPKYGVLENVVNIASERKGLEKQNVFSQTIACLVALGYQVHPFVVDAWRQGGSQHRSRVFMTIAAPGLRLMLAPWHTHASPEGLPTKSLHKLPCGRTYGQREKYPTPFSFVTAEEATRDLPDIGNGNVQTCISHPDHRVERSLNREYRAIIKHIPCDPPGFGLKEALKEDYFPDALKQISYSEINKKFRRINGKLFFPTITTTINPSNSRSNGIVHWKQHRVITVHEARRGQGIPDDEVVIGRPTTQLKIIGNGVDRNVSLALGLSLREAVVGGRKQPHHGDVKSDEIRVAPKPRAAVDGSRKQSHQNEVETDGIRVVPKPRAVVNSSRKQPQQGKSDIISKPQATMEESRTDSDDDVVIYDVIHVQRPKTQEQRKIKSLKRQRNAAIDETEGTRENPIRLDRSHQSKRRKL